MPHLKSNEKKVDPLWHEWDRKANKFGIHKTVYSVDGDEYTGDWSSNKRSGKGTYFWKRSGVVYDGNWLDGKRSGFGTLSVPRESEKTSLRKLYSGGWKNDMRHGFGTQYYNDLEHYEGEWFKDKRCGWGRMYYADGSAYEGEWLDDQRSGQGMLRLANNNRYEGSWKSDMKNGAGRFFYLDKGQLYDGVWVNDVAKCGQMTDFGREIATEPTEFPMPALGLLDGHAVLSDAKDTFLQQQS